jgi:hypothetical protein
VHLSLAHLLVLSASKNVKVEFLGQSQSLTGQSQSQIMTKLKAHDLLYEVREQARRSFKLQSMEDKD